MVAGVVSKVVLFGSVVPLELRSITLQPLGTGRIMADHLPQLSIMYYRVSLSVRNCAPSAARLISKVGVGNRSVARPDF